MASTSPSALAMATPTASVDIPRTRAMASVKSGFTAQDKLAEALLTPPNSISPDLHAQAAAGHSSPPPMSIADGLRMQKMEILEQSPAGTPLSKGALSGLDAAASITPALLAKHHLPGIMLGNGPRPIRYVMGELTHSVPGFSRIPPAKARRLVVAALESRHGGGPDGTVAFCKTGWGRWDAHIKGSPRDSGIGSFNEGNMSPPRSERSYAVSHNESGINIPVPRIPAGFRDHHSGASFTASSIREEDELDMDMDMPEDEADKMSLDGVSVDEDDDDQDLDDDTDEDDWAAAGPEALRKASLPTPGAPRRDYNALSASYSRRWPSSSWTRRPSAAMSDRRFTSASLPAGHALTPALATPDEQAAVAALMSMGSM